MQGFCKKCGSWLWLILGVLILLNVWWLQWAWSVFVGVIFVLVGVLGLFVPNSCPHCAAMAPKAKARRKPAKRRRRR